MLLLLAIAAALCFTIGGIFMKLSAGLTVLVPTLMVYLCFGIGASLQTLVLARSELGVTYTLILGIESVFAVAFGWLFFKENYSLPALIGMALVVAGVAILRTIAAPSG
jgi:multidrug transporter EmrE-like cation transporter